MEPNPRMFVLFAEQNSNRELVMSELAEKLKSLHTALIDSRNGYEEALADAGGKGLTSLFQRMIAVHGKDAEEIGACLQRHGEPVDDTGSYMSTVNRAVISLRSLLTGLDESILPGLIDGEERILGYYDEAVTASPSDSQEFTVLSEQREALRQTVAEMKRQDHFAA
jgi:uncharacterized protein (TIGR02284 family)